MLNRWADLIHQQNNHVRHFPSIPLYSTQISELADKEQITEGYRRSNTSQDTCQILSHSGRQHALGIRLQTLETLWKAESRIRIDNSAGEVAASS